MATYRDRDDAEYKAKILAENGQPPLEDPKPAAKRTKKLIDERLIGLDQFADGAVNEQFLHNLEKVLANIDDENTVATAARMLTIKIIVKPNTTRQILDITFTVVPKLASDEPISTVVYLGSAAGQATMHEQGSLLTGDCN